jgi:hypothetical protein
LWSRMLLEKLISPQLAMKFPAFYATRRLIKGVHNSPPLAPILSEINPFHVPSPSSYFLKSRLNINLPPSPRSSKSPLSLSFPHENPVCCNNIH